MNDSDSSLDSDEEALKKFYKQKANSLSLSQQQQLLQENKKINLNYVDHKLEMRLGTKVSNALKTQQVKIDDDRMR